MQDQFEDSGHFATPHASRYLQQLCKHWAHKVDVTYDVDRGHVALPLGPVELDATGPALVITLRAATAADLAQARSVIDDHLARFAAREGFTGMAWRQAASPPA